MDFILRTQRREDKEENFCFRCGWEGLIPENTQYRGLCRPKSYSVSSGIKTEVLEVKGEGGYHMPTRPTFTNFKSLLIFSILKLLTHGGKHMIFILQVEYTVQIFQRSIIFFSEIIYRNALFCIFVILTELFTLTCHNEIIN